MAEFNSSLPCRTENAGDIIIKICDPTTTTQQAAVTSNSELKVTVTDGSGNLVDPTDIRALTNDDVVTVEQGEPNSDLTKGWPIKITDGTTVVGVDGTSTGLKVSVVDALPTGTNTIGAVTQASGPWEMNLTEVGDSAIELGQTTMSASLPVTMASDQPPISVVISPAVPGTEVLSYYTEVDLAAAGVITKTYTVTALKVFSLQKIVASGSGKIKVEMKIAGATKVVLFNSTANPNVEYAFAAPQQVAAGVAVAVTITNRDKDAQDVYCTIEGFENDV